MAKTLQERITNLTWRRTGQKCYPWLGHIDKWGNGRIWIDKTTGSITIQRAIYLVEHGAVPEGFEVISCPVLKDCANPWHIGLATKTEIADRILWRKQLRRKTRQPSKLSDEEVRQIYFSTESAETLAIVYNLSKTHIQNIKAGRKYGKKTQFERKDDAKN